MSGSNLELAWLQENLGARLKLKPAEPMVPGSQYSHLRATSFGIDANTMHTAPRETYVKNVLDILGLGDNKCKPMPTPMVQTREKSDQDERRLGDEDRRAYHRWVGILRHLLKYRPDIAFTVHEVSKTLASPEDADLRRLLGKYLLGTQKLGIMIGKSCDPEHIDAYTDADWSGDSINRKNISGGILETGSATLREFTKGQSCQTLSSGESEYYAAVSTTAEAWHLHRFLEFLGLPLKLRLRIDSTAARGIIQRQGCGHLKHMETRLLWLQAKHEERKLTVIKEPTQTNIADGFTKALQTAKYLEWRNRLSVFGYDNGDDVETSKREALAVSGRWARVEALHAVPRSVLIATLLQQEFTTRRHRWNDSSLLSKA